MSYDFVALLPEVAGSDDATALRVGGDTFERGARPPMSMSG